MISIAVLGYGTVGSGVVEVLEKNKDVINQRAGDEISVKYVLDLRDFPGDPIQEKIVHDIDVSGKERGDIQQSACGKAWRDSSVYRKRAGDQFPV